MRKAPELRIGCSSWLDPSLLAEGTFYPSPRMTPEERLRWYARFFECVEVNATYYGIPAFHTAKAWAERTPQGFTFGVKAYGLMTGHHPKADRLPGDLRMMLPKSVPVNRRGEIDRKYFPREALDLTFEWFHDALTPLAEAGKLAYILFQLAPWVGYSTKGLDYLASLSERLPRSPIAIEFRNPSWIPKRTDEVLKFLADHRLIYVAVDCPWQPLIATATTDRAVFRFHGRNVKGWQAQMKGKHPTVQEKYDYLYSHPELEALANTIRSAQAQDVTVQFNNNNRDYPVRNALAFRRLMGQSILEIPRQLALANDGSSKISVGRQPPRGSFPGKGKRLLSQIVLT